MKIKLNELRTLIKRVINEELGNEIPIKQIMSGYIEAALWTEEERLTEEAESMYSGYDDEEDEEETELDRLIKITSEFNRKSFSSFEKDHIDTNSIINAYDDIKLFLSKIPKEILQVAFEEQSPESFGHDIWLTRNHHGAGFWDGDYSEEVEEVLMKAIKVLKEVNLVLGDDMMLYFE